MRIEAPKLLTKATCVEKMEMHLANMRREYFYQTGLRQSEETFKVMVTKISDSGSGDRPCIYEADAPNLVGMKIQDAPYMLTVGLAQRVAIYSRLDMDAKNEINSVGVF